MTEFVDSEVKQASIVFGAIIILAVIAGLLSADIDWVAFGTMLLRVLAVIGGVGLIIFGLKNPTLFYLGLILLVLGLAWNVIMLVVDFVDDIQNKPPFSWFS